MNDPYAIVIRPVVTEKSNLLREKTANRKTGEAMNQYVFEVATDANKYQVREAVEKIFDVRVLSVRTSIVRGKLRRVRNTTGRTKTWKKAVVKLAPGNLLQLY